MTDWVEGDTMEYLDVQFNMTTDSYKLFKKPKAKNKYINIQSDHPPAIIRSIPKIDENRISM